ncbi:MAG TPA: peptide deformylase [Gammaproteobacteria bacterium]|nr:peptide deformylase [Gammaproteobacteria bacterium]
MALLKILHYPDPRLRTKAEIVKDFGPDLQKMIDDMYETMYAAQGVGLAATQVNIHLRLAVMDVVGSGKQQICMINPEFISTNGTQIDQHGCLSVPGVPGAALKRAAKVHIRALDRFGKPFELEAEKTLAICIQHETDHLNGKLFIDHLSTLKRERLFKKAEKYRRNDSA